MFDPIRDDPEVKLRQARRQRKLRYECEIGRPCSDEEFDQVEAKRAEDEKAEWERRQRKFEADRREKEARDEARRQRVRQRLANRTSPPPSDEPPLSVEALSAASRSDQAFAERLRIEGDRAEPQELIVDLEAFNCKEAIFRHVRFVKGSNLRSAKFATAQFQDVRFESGVDLREADFEGAEFSEVTFSKTANIESASFAFAKFRKDNRIEFNRNYISNATFDEKRDDLWAKLSHSYAGLWQFVNFTLSGIYFTILLIKLYLFEALATVQAGMPMQAFFNAQTKFETKEVDAFTFLFGELETSMALALLILFYQANRLFLTTKFAPLIENEKRTGYTPPRDAYFPYQKWHSIGRFLVVIVAMVFLAEVLIAFDSEIIVPVLTESRPDS